MLYLFLVLFAVILLFTVAVSSFGAREEPVLNPIYIGDTGEKALALMVNVDWGEKVIPDMIRVFEEKNVRATFFITGRFAKKFPEIVQLIATSGHEVGNHGYSHPHADKISLEQNQKEISQTAEILAGLGVEVSNIFAPPYGEHKPHVLKAADSLGYKTIMWTVDTVDWQDPKPEEIISKVTAKADNGSLVLMHPKECTIEALPQLIEKLSEQGFVFKTVTEIIK